MTKNKTPSTAVYWDAMVKYFHAIICLYYYPQKVCNFHNLAEIPLL